MKLAKLRLDEIKLPNWDVRAFRDPHHFKALLEDMKHNGQCEPVHVMKTDDGYLLLEGRTRFEAAKKLGWKEIDAVIVERNIDDPYEYAFKVNAFKRSPGPVSTALYMQHLLISRKWSWGDLMRYLKVSKSTIARYMKLLDLPPEEQIEYEFGRKPIRNLDRKNVQSPTRGTRKSSDGGVRCPICGAYPSRKGGHWIYICSSHQEAYEAIMTWLARQGWREEIERAKPKPIKTIKIIDKP